MDESRQSSSSPVELAPYTGCPACRKDAWPLMPEPLKDYAIPEDSPDDIDWNVYYWGSDRNSGKSVAARQTIARPLPRNISERIPLEVFLHIIGFLPQRPVYLGSCALVCRTWYHLTQPLLYHRVVVPDLRRFQGTTQISRKCMGFIRMLEITRRSYNRHIEATHQSREMGPWLCNDPLIPLLVLCRRLHDVECLRLSGFTCLPYRRCFIKCISHFTRVVHLYLRCPVFHVFSDFRSLIYALKSLRELKILRGELVLGDLIREKRTAAAEPREPPDAPRLSRLTILLFVSKSFSSHIAAWIASGINTFKHCEHLTVRIAWRDGGGPSWKVILKSLSKSLTTLHYAGSALRDSMRIVLLP